MASTQQGSGARGQSSKPGSEPLEIILIHIGSAPPAYLDACRRQIEAIAGRPPLMVHSKRASSFHSPKLERFRTVEQLSGFGLEGFWRYACERFFVLEEFMGEAGLDRCIHLESDNLLYASPSELATWLDATYGGSIAVCPSTDTEDTAALMYVGSRAALSSFTDGLVRLVELGPGGLNDEYGEGMPHEMKMLHILRTSLGLCKALPTTVANARALDSQYVFDPSAYGQHVDGTVFEPGIRYAAEHQQVGRELLTGASRLVWDAGREQPFVYSAADDHRFLPLANLHIHSKRLDQVVAGRLTVASPARRGIKARFRSTIARARVGGLARSAFRR